MISRARAKTALMKIIEEYPDAKCGLDFQTPFELLIATILSAQCTDERVNIVTKELFQRLREPADIEFLPHDELEIIIKSCGLYKAKAKYVENTCIKLVNNFDGIVPDNYRDLMSLDGVGRKVASVVMANAYNIPAMPVDTHILRITNLIGVADKKDPLIVEKAICDIIPKKHWNTLHLAIIAHGRSICTARSPKCEKCAVNSICEFFSLKK